MQVGHSHELERCVLRQAVIVQLYGDDAASTWLLFQLRLAQEPPRYCQQQALCGELSQICQAADHLCVALTLPD